MEAGKGFRLLWPKVPVIFFYFLLKSYMKSKLFIICFITFIVAQGQSYSIIFSTIYAQTFETIHKHGQ